MFNQIDFTRHTLYINITMDKYKDFPEPPRQMTDEEGEHYFFNMLKQIQDFDPDEIIASHDKSQGFRRNHSKSQ